MYSIGFAVCVCVCVCVYRWYERSRMRDSQINNDTDILIDISNST